MDELEKLAQMWKRQCEAGASDVYWICADELEEALRDLPTFEDGSSMLAFAEFELELDTQASPCQTGTSATETHMNVGDKVRVLPSEDHSHSNRNGTIARAEIMISPGDTDCFRVKLVSPTRRPSLISHTTYQRATLNAALYSDELEVVVMYHGE